MCLLQHKTQCSSTAFLLRHVTGNGDAINSARIRGVQAHLTADIFALWMRRFSLCCWNILPWKPSPICSILELLKGWVGVSEGGVNWTYFGILVGSKIFFSHEKKTWTMMGRNEHLAEWMMSHLYDSPESSIVQLVIIQPFVFQVPVNILSFSGYETLKVSCLFFDQWLVEDIIKDLFGSGFSQKLRRACYCWRCTCASAMCVLCAGLDADLLAVIPAFSRHPSLKHLMLGKNFNIKGR